MMELSGGEVRGGSPPYGPLPAVMPFRLCLRSRQGRGQGSGGGETGMV